MKKKNITIDDLAIMVQRGFEEITRETAKGFEATAKKVEANKRFDNIEKLILLDHGIRIEKLEKGMKEIKQVLS